jgi:hypothetical protein
MPFEDFDATLWEEQVGPRAAAAQIVPALLGIQPEKSAARQLARCAGPDAGVKGRPPGGIKLVSCHT